MKILGIIHHEKNIEPVYEYIISQKPTKVMLEIDPKQDNSIKTYFTTLEDKILAYKVETEEQANGVIIPFKTIEVIRGDIYEHEAYPYAISVMQNASEIMAKLIKMSSEERNKELDKMKRTAIREGLSKKNLQYREKGMIETANATNPDIIVVGSIHAIPLKEYFKDATLELCFNKKSLLDLRYIPSTIVYALRNNIIPHIKLL